MSAISDVPRPLIRYHGGKWRLAPWIISHYPHPLYDELYHDWTHYDHTARDDRANLRVERIWVTPGMLFQLPLLMEAP